ncbi:MAG: bifunctional methylenetetrahydrofolate dehydrogenase/methenyltetrahydrofolate cyclohydrolase FolD [Thermodesulfobacteriota bacterium]
MTLILDGKATAAAIRAELRAEVAQLSELHGRPPGLAVILVGEDPASQVYVRNKEKACAEVGVVSFAHRLPGDAGQEALEGLILRLNADPAVDGVLVQLPLPKGLDKQAVLDLIDPDKDVDGFHPMNMGRLALGLPGFRPCTPAGVIELLRRHGITTAGKKAVVVGRSNIVGRPMSIMLSGYGAQADATVTVVHTKTPPDEVPAICRSADILVVAAGSPRCIPGDWVKDGAVVVDVGIHRMDDGSLCGDCDYSALRHRTAAITPVPGGVGPMTIAMLLTNTVQAYREHMGT